MKLILINLFIIPRHVLGKKNYLQLILFSLYVTKLVLDWIKDQGGPESVFEKNTQKSSALYDEIDSSDGFYNSIIEKGCRSQMNIPFRIGNNDVALETEFLKQAAVKHMVYLKGHR